MHIGAQRDLSCVPRTFQDRLNDRLQIIISNRRKESCVRRIGQDSRFSIIRTPIDTERFAYAFLLYVDSMTSRLYDIPTRLTRIFCSVQRSPCLSLSINILHAICNKTSTPSGGAWIEQKYRPQPLHVSDYRLRESLTSSFRFEIRAERYGLTGSTRPAKRINQHVLLGFAFIRQFGT